MNTVRQLWSILGEGNKKRCVFLVFLTTLSGFVEVLSVGLVLPFIAFAAGALPYGKANQITRYVENITDSLGVPRADTVIALGLLFLGSILLANAYVLTFQLYNAWFVQKLRVDLSQRVLNRIISQPFEYLDQVNTSEFLKLTTTDVGHVALMSNALIQMAALSVRIAVVYVFLLYAQTKLALLMAFAFLSGSLLLYTVIQKPISRAGALTQMANSRLFRVTNEILVGYRDVRAAGVHRQFSERVAQAAEMVIRPQTINTMPTYVARAGFEILTVTIIIGLLVYFKQQDGNLANGLPLLSAYAVAGIRLLPAAQQGVAQYLSLKFYSPALDEISKLFGSTDPTPLRHDTGSAPLKFDKGIRLENVSYAYNGLDFTLLDVSLTIPKHTRAALVGETGAGKSTLLDLVLALRHPSRGRLLVDDQLITKDNASQWRGNIGYVPQQLYLIDGTVAENVAFGHSGDGIDMERVRRACSGANISAFLESLENGYDTLVGERGVRFSGGQCQRLGIARALYNDPELIIFDEATSSLDAVTERAILDTLDNLKGEKTVLVVAHRLSTIWNFDTIFVMEGGRVTASGTAENLLKTSEVFRTMAEHHHFTAVPSSSLPYQVPEGFDL